MGHTVTINFSEENYTAIQALANENNFTVDDLIKKVMIELTPHTEVSELTLEDIDNRASNLDSGKKFKISELFTNTLWESYSVGSRISVGKQFSKKVKNDINYSSKYEFIKKDTDNAAVYQRKEDNC